jgi:predicted  nucleic acid-binding Zn-ribbon protein
MKPQEILLASAVIALVAGAGASLAARAFQTPARAEADLRAVPAPLSTSADALPETARALDELRLENTSLRERLATLEARISELSSSRTPVALDASTRAALHLAGTDAGRAPEAFAADDDFVASVGRALDEIERREDAEREVERKAQQAERIEQRVARLQQELGLTNRQASDLRTTLIGADDKREAIFDSLRESEGDPREMRESFRTLRDETYTSLQTILTPEQLETYRQRDEEDFGRRGPPDFGGAPPDGQRRREGERPREGR